MGGIEIDDPDSFMICRRDIVGRIIAVADDLARFPRWQHPRLDLAIRFEKPLRCRMKFAQEPGCGKQHALRSDKLVAQVFADAPGDVTDDFPVPGYFNGIRRS